MRRREFITLVGSAATAWPFVARAQQPERMRRVGVLMPASESDPEGQQRITAFQRGLDELGWRQGRNVHIDYRWGARTPDLLSGYAAELVNLTPEAILAGTTAAAVAVKRATTAIPIVAALVIDPIGLGLVASHARPGGNVTGILASLDVLPGKQLEILREMVPRMSMTGMLVNVDNPQNLEQSREAAAAAGKLGIKLVVVEVRSADDLDVSLGSLARHQVEAVLLSPDPFLSAERRRIAGWAVTARVATMYSESYNVADGGLVSYGVNRSENFHRAAAFVDKILRGTKPDELPVELPTKLELAVNLKTAKALGLAIPQSILLRADEVIE